MKTILEELYRGQIFPDELIVAKNPEYRPLNRNIAGIRETLQQKLPEDDHPLLESFLDLHYQSSAMEASASFEYGFKLGAMIMLEVLAGKGDLVRGGD